MVKFVDAAGTLISREDGGGHIVVIEKGDPRFAEWLALKPAPFIPPPLPDPLEFERAGMVVSRFQAMAALMDAGLLADAQSALAGAGPLAQLAWAEAVEFRRNSPAIKAIAAGLGLKPEQVDDLFRAAKQIEV